MTKYNLATLKFTHPLNIPRLPPTPIPQTLTATATFKAFMPDHLSLVAYFARYSAQQMNITCSKDIHLPVARTIYNVIKGPFVHAKAKELFQENVHAISIQLYDADKESMMHWMDYVNKKLPSGIEMNVEMFTWHSIPTKEETAEFEDSESETLLHQKESIFHDRVMEKKRQLIDLLSK